MRIAEINMLKAMGYPDSLIKGLKKSIKGTQVTMASSGVTSTSIQLIGIAKFLLGFRCFFGTAGTLGSVTILLNNEKIWDTVDETLSDAAASSVREEYIETFRQLIGNDVINVQFSNPSASSTVTIMAFYLQ